jgi:hypothetical protein
MDVGRVIQAAKRAIGDLVDADALDGQFARRDIIVEAFEKLAEEEGTMECTPKVRHQIKGPATLNGGELCWCPDNSIPVN